MVISCQVCQHGIEIPKSFDLNQFDGQIRCTHCGWLYRIKLQYGHLKRYGLMARQEYE